MIHRFAHLHGELWIQKMVDLERLIQFRRELHQHPERSNGEFETVQRVAGFINSCAPDEEINLCKTGKAFVFNSGLSGPTVVFRAELDGLLIQEKSDLPHASRNPGVAHLCGHDGHMAILSGLAPRIAACRPQRGKVVLLFQPAEEVEQGARDVVVDEAFQALAPDYIFALHNLPGKKLHDVFLRNGSFAAASRGMTIKLSGKTAHAGEPENGLNPVKAIAQIIQDYSALVEQKGLKKILKKVLP